MINPTKEQGREYAALLEAFDAALGAIGPGKPASGVFLAAADALQRRPEGGGALAAQLMRTAGFATVRTAAAGSQSRRPSARPARAPS